MNAPTSYPLAWPTGKPRTPGHRREDGRFSGGKSGWASRADGTNEYRPAPTLTIAKARERLNAELSRMGARSPVLSTNVELTLLGVPRSEKRAVEDPGAAVYFQLSSGNTMKPIALACDRYKTVAANIAAIAAHVDAMRTAERHGVGSLEQMFAGFAALPPAENDWGALLGNPTTLDQAEAVYKALMRRHHPDLGGSEDQAAALNVAIEQARAVLR